MFCKDCIHYEICLRYHRKKIGDFDPDKISRVCDKYKNAAKVVALPVNVGDTVYSYCECFHRVLAYFVESLQIGYLEENENYCTYIANSTCGSELYDSIDFDLEDVGKTIFFSEEDAYKQKETVNRK